MITSPVKPLSLLVHAVDGEKRARKPLERVDFDERRGTPFELCHYAMCTLNARPLADIDSVFTRLDDLKMKNCLWHIFVPIEVDNFRHRTSLIVKILARVLSLAHLRLGHTQHL